MANPPPAKHIIHLTDMVQWFLTDRAVELRFKPVTEKRYPGKHSPYFHFEHWIDGRQISEKTLAMLIVIDLGRRDYRYSLAQVISALVEQSWHYYVLNQEVPAWLDDATPPLHRKPVGRPRTKPKRLKVAEFDDPLLSHGGHVLVNIEKDTSSNE